MTEPRIYLSPPHMSCWEQPFVQEAVDSNWIARVGPHVVAFEREFCEAIGAEHAVALSSGTAGLHLALQLVGVERGDEVLASTLTFSASVNPILYLGGYPTFVDSERQSWNMDPELLAEVLAERERAGRLPKAVVLVHLYGQSADVDPIVELCYNYDVMLVEDAAEALGATYKGRAPVTFGKAGVFSFNGNKRIATSGSGMLASGDEALVEHAGKHATRAPHPARHYQHSEIGYNNRLSNVLAGIGRVQLRVLHDRVAARHRNFKCYQDALGDAPGVETMQEATWGRRSRCLDRNFTVIHDAVRICAG